MVGPVSNEERDAFTRKLKVGFVVLVGLSAGLITLQGDPSVVVFVGAVLGGLAIGAVLTWFIAPEIEYRDQRP
jgi:hypothetical protein